MRSRGWKVGLVVLAGAALAATASVVAVAAGPPAAAGQPVRANALLAKYRLAPAALVGLPSGIALERLGQRLPTAAAPRGIQYFQAPTGLSGMFLLQGAAPSGNRLWFPLAGEWTFLGGRKFQQLDANGNRLVLEDDKAQVFDAAGRQIGALGDPALRRAFDALLKLTM